MHNLFLNIVQYHIRCVLGIGSDLPAPAKEATPKEMVTARKVYAKGKATTSQLRKLKNQALIGLCAENEIALPKSGNKNKLRKLDIISILVVGFPLVAFDISNKRRPVAFSEDTHSEPGATQRCAHTHRRTYECPTSCRRWNLRRRFIRPQCRRPRKLLQHRRSASHSKRYQ